ncbi:MAG: type VII secretion protein EssC [Bacilli bacterium]|nr:type VII secretion protein EssC [Bacilli bacterium]
MRLYIQEKDNLIKFNLPAKIDGSILYSFKSSDSGIENTINIDAIKNEWILKSNGSINIYGGTNEIIEAVKLEEYRCIPVYTAASKLIYIFCLPSVCKKETCYDISNITTITVGSGNDNTIQSTQKLMSDKHAVIQRENNFNFIYPASNSNNIYIYVNNKRVTQKTQLFVGDIIFMNGFRLIWMNQFIKIPMDTNLYNVHGLSPKLEALTKGFKDYTPVEEYDSNVPLYTDDQYFSHMPRIRTVPEEFNIKVDAPPGNMNPDNDMPFLLSIGSSFTIVGMMAIYGLNIYSNVKTGETDLLRLLPQIFMLISMLIGSALIPFFTRRWSKKMAKKREEERQEKYTKYLEDVEEKIKVAKAKQEQIFRENYLTGEESLTAIKSHASQLWNKEIVDDDFIEVRLGTGDRPSLIKVQAPEESFTLDDDNLLQAVIELGKRYNLLHDVPITINFKEEIATALVLFNKNKESFLNNIMVQLLTTHSPLNLKIVIMTNNSNSSRWDYLRYTPHCWSDDKEVRYFANNSDDLKVLCQVLDNEFIERRNAQAEKMKESKELVKDDRTEAELYDSYYLIITDDFKSLKNYKFINDLLESEYNFGFSMVVIEDSLKNMPKECKKFVVIDDNEGGMFNSNITEEQTIKFKAEYFGNYNMREVGNVISNIPVQGKDAERQLPTSLSFMQMYNIGNIKQFNVRNRWMTSDPMTTLAAPVGVHTNGDLFYLNLHEKYDGPHGLIAGSTGSGKSEFIITYILSMALNYDPKEVQFVLIDYKGGGLAGAFENRELGYSIPHLAGTITNLDTAEMNRTLVSIQSELKRRQAKFNEYKEKVGESTMDIYKYQRLYRDGLIDEPISHLFIISDEFAELKSQQPEFMDQLVSTARIGRSLGVHLILATQKPSGVVNDQIWSNSKFKVCLKVQTKSDSMEMLKRPEAASIKETGRFYLQVGYDEYFDIGQSAWSGDRYVPVERIIKKLDDSINFVNNTGNIIKNATDAVNIDTKTEDLGDQLTNIVKYLYETSKEDNFEIKKLWLPPLSKTIILQDLLNKYKDSLTMNELVVPIGEYDAPIRQEQGLFSVNLLKGNVLINGVPSSGKENVISTMVQGLCQFHTPEEVNIYIGDFGAETLKIFNKYPQVGDVFVTEEAQKLTNLIKMLNKEFETRKKKYSDFGGNFIEYNKLSGEKDNAIVVFLNNFENFTESYPRMSDIFSTLFRDGYKYGIIFVVTAAVNNAIRARDAQNFIHKICLKLSNDMAYREMLGAPKGLIPADNYGRGLFTVDNSPALEFQTADICNRDDKTKYVIDFAKVLKDKYKNSRAKSIPVLPDIAYVDDYMYELDGLECVPIGVEVNSLEVYVHNFVENKINLVAAKAIKSHTYFLYALIKQMLTIPNVKVNVVDALSIYRGEYDNVNVYNENLEQGFVRMYNSVIDDSKATDTNVFFVIGVKEFKDEVKGKYGDKFESLFGKAKDCKNNIFVFLDDSDSYKSLQVEDWYRKNINNTFGIWLGEDISIQVALGVTSLSIEDKQVMFPFIGYPVYQGNYMIMKYVVDGVDRKDEE